MIGHSFLQRAMPREQRRIDSKCESVADFPRPRRPTSRHPPWRERQRNGHAIFKSEADHDAIVVALIEAGRIDERAALDHRAVEAALAAVLQEWAARWSR